MTTLKITLNQRYRSFEDGFNIELEGKLIILSGVNGSGKSQLINIISQRESPGNQNLINTQVFIDGNKISRSEIVRRSFKENVNVPELTRAGTEVVRSHKDQVWNAYHNYRLNHDDVSLWDYKRSSQKAKEILVHKFGSDKFQDRSITQEELREVLPEDFIWKSDDIFTNFIGELFFNYAIDVYHALAEAGRSGIKVDNSSLPDAPWKQLNELFRELNFAYRFKEEFFIKKNFEINEQPFLYQVDSAGNIIEQEKRRLSDLSDGEKGIIALTFASLSGVKQDDQRMLLLDEFDANFNPSLTEIFYKVLDRHFISRGIIVVIATHSPTTISLAPEYAQFYEVFKNGLREKRILPVQRSEYADIQIANKTFFDKIADQESRIISLIGDLENQKKVEQTTKPALMVEDEYDQIYKIAWFKLNDIVFTYDIEDIKKKFQNAPFNIYGTLSASGVSGLLRCNNASIFSDKKIVGLFDYDEEGSRQFYSLHKGAGWNKNINGDLSTGLFKKRDDHPCFYSMLLPIPDRLVGFVTDVREKKFTSFVEVENLLPAKFLIDKKLAKVEKVLDKNYLKINSDKKSTLWKELASLDKESFADFKPLFNQLDILFEY